jgi:predicted tellurium resistance membrane protein TerC
MEFLTDPQAWAALVTLTVLEIVLGIDNIIFLSILVAKLPKHQQHAARVLGLGFAMATRIALLLSITWVMKLTTPLFELMQHAISGRDLILFFGGLFLIAKATVEIHSSLEGIEQQEIARAAASFIGIVLQIGIIDIVFSLDSVITAVGLAQDVAVMVIAIVIAVIVMMFAARAVGEFVDRHPTVKMLALSFLILIGVALVAESAGLQIPKGYIYFAMAFSVVVEMLNIQLRRRAEPVKLRRHMEETE